MKTARLNRRQPRARQHCPDRQQAVVSYPGYSEILTGEARDDLITSNDKKRNPQTTVLEFLKTKLRLTEKQVAVFASWDTIPFIAAREAGAMTTNAGYEEYEHPDAGVRELSRQQFETPTPWDSVRPTSIRSVSRCPPEDLRAARRLPLFR